MKTLLVTGGAGYIGSHTVRLLCAAGHKIVVLDNLIYGHEEAIVDDAFAGNTSTIDDKYAYDYNLVEIFGEYSTKVRNLPVSVYGNQYLLLHLRRY